MSEKTSFGNNLDDICSQHCGTADCYSYGCIIKQLEQNNFTQPEQGVVNYFGRSISVLTSQEDLLILAEEIGVDKHMGTDEVLRQLTLLIKKPVSNAVAA